MKKAKIFYIHPFGELITNDELLITNGRGKKIGLGIKTKPKSMLAQGRWGIPRANIVINFGYKKQYPKVCFRRDDGEFHDKYNIK